MSSGDLMKQQRSSAIFHSSAKGEILNTADLSRLATPSSEQQNFIFNDPMPPALITNEFPYTK